MPTRQAAPPAAPRPAAPQTAMAPAPAPPSAIGQAAPQQPGMFAQMATTAAGVAVGSAVGHTLANGVSSLFGGSSSEPEQQQQQQAPPQQQYQQPQYQQFQAAPAANACEADAKAFTNCLETNNNDFGSCQWYLEALKSCQQMSANY
ncbi:hypothetical protein BDF21DRAFT_423906 [Thamnidium elegans]|nr:hypothetical protein BDF21DRAFT_423906 [Thamnidium elegans]